MILPRLMSHASTADRPGHVLRIWTCAFVLFSLLYIATMNTSIQGRDSGFFVNRAFQGKWRNPSGLVSVHPLHYGLSRFLIKLDLMPPYTAVTLLSALPAAATVANVLIAVLLITRSFGAAAVCAASLGIAHTFWQLATMAEVLTLSTLILSAELLAVVAFARSFRFRWLVLAYFLNGLGCSNHLQHMLSLPALFVLTVAVVGRQSGSARMLPFAALAWLVGSLPYTGLVAMELAGGASFRDTIRSALLGAWASSVLNVVPTRSVLFTVAFFPIYNFPNLLLPLSAIGIWGARRLGLSPVLYGYLLMSLGLHALFVVRYSVSDQYTFFLPMYTLLAVFAGIGWKALEVYTSATVRSAMRTAAVALIALTPLAYAVVPSLARQSGMLSGVVKDRPYDDAYRRLLIPWSCADRAVQIVIERAFELAGPKGLILVEDTFQHAAAIEYFQNHEALNGVSMIKWPKFDGTSRQELLRFCDREAHDGRTVVLVPAIRGTPLPHPPRTRWQPADELYVLNDGP